MKTFIFIFLALFEFVLISFFYYLIFILVNQHLSTDVAYAIAIPFYIFSTITWMNINLALFGK